MTTLILLVSVLSFTLDLFPPPKIISVWFKIKDSLNRNLSPEMEDVHPKKLVFKRLQLPYSDKIVDREKITGTVFSIRDVGRSSCRRFTLSNRSHDK